MGFQLRRGLWSVLIRIYARKDWNFSVANDAFIVSLTCNSISRSLTTSSSNTTTQALPAVLELSPVLYR